jgi:thiosulfate/3-mercaptopyruvate sulfurtransferase
MKPISERGYVHPELLVTTEWVAEHLDDPNVRIVESDEDVLLYEQGHIRNAVKIDWEGDLNHPITRDYIDGAAFARLVSRFGITPETIVVFYGDKNNWWAGYALWVFQLFGHQHVRLMDGGRIRWEKDGRDWTRDVPSHTPSDYPTPVRRDAPIRAFVPQVLEHITAKKKLVDVRSPEEYSGEMLHMPDYPQEGALRGGHIPGAVNIPWKRAVNEDGTFKPADELRQIYEAELGLRRDDDVIVYCRIGERSSLSWFVLTYLLGYPRVRNYDGSWTEWGNMVGVPIENPSAGGD